MRKVIKKKETISVEGLKVSDFLKEDFLDKISSLGKKVDPISLVFVVENADEKEKDKRKIDFVVMGHNNNSELDKNVMTFDASPEISEKLVNIIEKMEAKEDESK